MKSLRIMALALSLALGACVSAPSGQSAGSQGAPTVQTHNFAKPGPERLRMFYMWGVGDATFSSGINDIMAQTKARYGSKVAIFGPYHWYDTEIIAQNMHATPSSIMVGVMGVSCGSSGAPYAAAAAGRTVAIAEGIQASEWCPTVSLEKPVAANTQHACETYNPIWAMTGGLGAAEYVPAPGTNAARITIVQRYDTHIPSFSDPDAQADMVDCVAQAFNAGTRRGAGPIRRLVLHHGERMH